MHLTKKRGLSFSLMLATSLIQTLAAAADPTPIVVEAPPIEGVSGPLGVSRTSDLPAPDTSAFVNRPLLITSSLVLVASYVPMAVIAFTSDRPEDQTNLYYPVVGPWMNLATRCETRNCDDDTLNKVLLVADGVGQGLGAIGVVASFFVPGKTTRNWYLIGDGAAHAAPGRVGIAGYGFTAAGTF